MRRGETAAGHFLSPAAGPCDFDVLAARGEFDKLAKPAKESFRIGAAGESDCSDAGEMTGPLAFQKVFVITGRDDMATEIIAFINPIFVEQHLVVPSAAEAAIEDMIAALKRLPRPFSNDQSAGTQMLAENPEAANFRFRRKFVNDACYSGSMAVNVATFPGHGCYLKTFFGDCYVIGESQTVQKRMRTVNARVEYRDFDVRASAAAEERAGLLDGWQRVRRHSLQPTVQLNNFNSTSCDKIAVAR